MTLNENDVPDNKLQSPNPSTTKSSKKGPSEDRIQAPEESLTLIPDGDWGPERFLERELSWLKFNERVLQLTEDENLPLLERTNFLSIFSSNLDEFFKVRVAGLKRRIDAGIAVPTANGMSPTELMAEIAEEAHKLQERQAKDFSDHNRPELEKQNIKIIDWDDLKASEQDELNTFFDKKVLPILTPLAVDPAHPFPYISGLSLNLAVIIRNPANGKELFSRIKVPDQLDRFIPLDGPRAGASPDRPARFLPVEDLISHHLDELFPGMEILENHSFRVTRNEDLEVEEDDAENLLTAMEKELTKRRFGAPVRLEIANKVSKKVEDLLVNSVGVDPDLVYKLPTPLDLTRLSEIAKIDRPDLHYPHFVPRTNRYLKQEETSDAADIFSAVSRSDVLLHHPYDSFSTSVQAFLEQAAADPKVQAIKQTLYRTSGDSPIFNALIEAAQAGKQVLAVVELKARFDEEANIKWARRLERAGVHVVYGIVGLKTHAKLSLVVRQESDGLKRYCHIGTGNYHPSTARFYEDYGLLTKNPQVGEDVSNLFNQLSGYAPNATFKRLLVAPRTVRSGLMDLIEQEIENKRAGKEARIHIKVNSIVDELTIDALYRASQEGVKVDLIVRGICTLRPHIEGLSENINVHSILGRFLEHSRVYAFHNDGNPQVYIGSADLMHRNLDRRVEALVLLENPEEINNILTVLTNYSSNGTSSWHLEKDGDWRRYTSYPGGEEREDIQSWLIEEHTRPLVSNTAD